MAMRVRGMMALIVATMWIPNPACADARPDYLAIVEAYANAMIENGRDVYGDEHSPLFAAALDRRSMQLGSRESFGSIPGVREHDRSLGGANPQEDLPLYAILYELTDLTGEQRYAREADRALEYFFSRCQSPETGLMAWGEHLYWDFRKEACGGNDWHEIEGEWPFWDACYRLAPEPSWRFAIGQWDHQIADKTTGDFSRHARWSRHEPGRGFEFPRYAGQMIVNWADAYRRRENAERDRRAELHTAIAVVVGRMEANTKLARSGYLPAGRATAGSHIDVVWLGSNLELARCLWKAAPHVDDELAERMRDLALQQDAAFHKAPHQIASGGGFAVTLDATSGEPRSRGTNRPYTEVWATGYGHGTHAGLANRCYDRHEQIAASHVEIAARYRTLMLAAAEQYLSATPATDDLQKPGAVAQVIQLMLNAYDMTSEEKYVERADYFGRIGISLFLDDGLPLPKASSQHAHYEAITGGPSLMHALLQLHVADPDRSVQTSSPESDGIDPTVVAESPEQPPVIPLGLDAYRHWDRWPYQRIGVRAYMRSTYDRAGGNETADASHFLYQTAEDFNVTLDVEGAGVLYFKRTNHWHGSPWHYEVDGVDHIVQETTTADPTRKLDHAVFLPEQLFPHPLTWTYAQTHGADLMWVPIAFEHRLRLAYSRTFYGTGYYIYHLIDRAARLSQPLRAWDGATPPDEDVLDWLRAAGTDIAPRRDDGSAWGSQVAESRGAVDLPQAEQVELVTLGGAPAMLRALEISAPRDRAVQLGRAALRITWDGRAQPSVDAPVALFFGSGTLHNRDDAEYLVRAQPVHIRFDDQRVHLACYFPMPFFRSARIELEGPAEGSIEDVRWSVRTVPYTDPPNHVGYFHATYRDHAEPERGQDLVFLDTRQTEGGGDWSGSFVGTSFIFTEAGELTTLEGDPRFFFDDSQTPQAQGTGTEEWGGGGDYWGGRNMTIPLAGHPVGTRRPEDAASDEERIHSAYRYLLADLMPFGKRAVIRFEHGATNQSRERYRSVTYWYGLPAASLVLTADLNVGEPESEERHDYCSPQASEPYEITSRYEWGVDTLPAPQDDAVLAEPRDFAEFEFQAAADTTYTIWLRGKSAEGLLSDATWFQFDDKIGTDELDESYAHPKGFGNWRDDTPADTWSWSSALPQDPPQTVTFDRGGLHRLRVQCRHAPHVIDQIWLSASQQERPAGNEPAARPDPQAGLAEIVLDAGDVQRLEGRFRIIDEDSASVRRAIEVGGGSGSIEIYPAHTEIGRRTAGTSEFTLPLRPDNFGVLLRRTLDYRYPNQRAEVYVTDAAAAEPDWQHAGSWYLAGSNTWYHSWAQGELGPSRPAIKTSNRRFRDDEFLISRALTRGITSLTVRVIFTPVEIPLLPGRECGPLAWSEIRYRAYCYVMPEFEFE